jgi:hypothetical protein
MDCANDSSSRFGFGLLEIMYNATKTLDSSICNGYRYRTIDIDYNGSGRDSRYTQVVSEF